MSQTKKCKWCGETITRTNRQAPSVWKTIKVCSKSCGTSYKWNKCSKAQMPTEPVKHCVHCETLLVRKEGEHRQAWEKRKYCNKSCAAFGSTRSKAVFEGSTVEDEMRLGLVRYVRGTDEFNQIARLYA